MPSWSSLVVPVCLVVSLAACDSSRQLPASEMWDLASGRELERVGWGSAGWHVSGNEQFKSPATIRVVLPGQREIAGEFAIARVISRGNQVDGASLKTAPCTASEAYSRARAMLEGLRAKPEDFKKLEAWYHAGPRSSEGEQLVVNFSSEGGFSLLGIWIDWVLATDSARNWVVAASFYW
jgi:hypothetical protein